jgi:hypothetical protein
MTRERYLELVAIIGEDRITLAKLLGYKSENSLRHCEAGRAMLPPEKAAWLERYAKHRQRTHETVKKADDIFFRKYPPPGEKTS